MNTAELQRLADTYGPDPSELEGDEYGDLLVEAYVLAGADLADEDAWQAAQEVAVAYPEPTTVEHLVGRLTAFVQARW